MPRAVRSGERWGDVALRLERGGGRRDGPTIRRELGPVRDLVAPGRRPASGSRREPTGGGLGIVTGVAGDRRFGLDARAGRSRIALIVIAVCWMNPIVAPDAAHSYRFLRETFDLQDLGRANHGSAPIDLWDPEVWGPGRQLSFALVDHSLWDLWGGFDEVQRVGREAMQAWSDIGTADIRWELVGGKVGGADPGPSVARILPDSRESTGTRIRYGANGLITECEIIMHVHNSVNPTDLLRGLFMHELGHCLGLHHPANFPRNAPGIPEPAAWRDVQIMSGSGGRLTWDDQVGASLLRPDEGWIKNTGVIWGNVLLESGDPAARAVIVATRIAADGEMIEALTRITDRGGVFVIGGLEPGRYTLRVQPMRRVAGDFRDLEVDLGIRATVRAAPVRVSAGARTGPITLTVRRGEPVIVPW